MRGVREMPVKKGIIVAALVMATALISLAETPPDPYVVEDLDQLGTRGGRITVDLPAEPQTFNPILAKDDNSQAVTSLMHATLFEDDGDDATLVKSFNVSTDNTDWTLRLREGIRFSDGEPFTCADVEFTFEEVLFNPEVASSKEVWRVNGQLPYTVDCENEHTVKMTTPPMAERVFKHLLSYQEILPQHALADAVARGTFNTTWGTDVSSDQLVGLGPFQLASYVPGEQVVLRRNLHYWKVDSNGTQLPYLAEIRMPIVRTDSVRVLNYINGRSDAMRPRPEDVRPIQNAGRSVEVGRQVRQRDSIGFIFNQDVSDLALRVLFRNVNFRQAMSHAADRESMITLSRQGYAEARCGPGIAPLFWIQNDSAFPCFPFNLEKTIQTLDRLQLKDVDGDGTRNITEAFLNRPKVQEALACMDVSVGDLPAEADRELEFTILTVQGSKSLVTDAQLYAEKLRSIGLEVQSNAVPFSTFSAKLRSGDYHAARINFMTNGDPSVIATIYASTGRRHYWKPSDAQGSCKPAWQARVDELFGMQKAGSGAERRAWMEEFQILVARHVPMVFLYDVRKILAYRQDRIGNFEGIAGQAILEHPDWLFRKDL